MAAIDEHNSRLTTQGCSVLLDINDGERLVFARLSPNANLKIGKKNCSLQPLIGCPFGSLFRVDNGDNGPYLSRVVLTDKVEEEEEEVEKDGGDSKQKEEDCVNVDGKVSKDNRELVDNNTAQSLTGEDIDEMRRQGASGDQIIEALIANSATFEMKTAFSQEKYRLRKQKKYAPKVLVRRPFARSIGDAYFKKYPTKIGFLRSDSLSLLLSMGNVMAHSDILVVDVVGGLVTGAVAERLGGTGYVCNIHLGATPYPMDIVRIFNFSDDICKRIVQCSVSNLCPGQDGDCEQEQNLNLQVCDSNKDVNDMEQDIPVEENRSSVSITCKTNTDHTTCKPIKAGEKASEDLVNSWKNSGFSSLIIAAQDLEAWSILQKLLPLLSYSAPFAIYHQYLQPLASCMHNLQGGKMAVNLQISEPWLREYQVLPSRTHPKMQMSAFGGYILSGTKICENDAL